MLSRRSLLACSAAICGTIVVPASAHPTGKKPFKVDPKFEPQSVRYFSHPPGTIVVDTGKHFLYLVESYGSARRYGIGVGKAGRSLKGEAVVERKAKWPSWRPTANMIRREPGKYAKYAAGVPGGPGNPLGSRALYLYRNGRDTMYRIHGTTEPSSIGRSVSNGCVRMINVHVEDLFERVPLGTRVIIL
ncbi:MULTISPECIES: L,D-transpeptidase [Stappiaceae]|jgi:lipoprotein-anchoring transpeptidase ErfK/SrfK|uniref:L,D-transpeptidase n=1 Tax=Stappiaceae TaxID=2821832 RepID=UPI0009FABFFD|nr:MULTISPECIES: L,D-transpeptidase [Stappiaceae]MBO9463223.1 L,D-transpeptidase [Labrenzia sp. R5_0]UES53882.1 L,D-transpeptidase family protein [Roseibium aggregatum]UFI06774.1 L,D-transpeptidase [Roseibium aggregatum]